MASSTHEPKKQHHHDADEQTAHDSNDEIVAKLNRHVQNYLINIRFPATVSPPALLPHEQQQTSSTPLRTDFDFIQHRLIESGVLFNDYQSVSQVTEALSGFIAELDQSGCYEMVHAAIGKQPQLGEAKEKDTQKHSIDGNDIPQGLPGKLDILLKEKKWYKIYVGGGIKQDTKDVTFAGGGPKAQFETNVSLLNLKGCTDKTRFSYAVDQTSTTTVSLSHDAPLYSFFGKNSLIQNSILLSSGGSKTHGSLRAIIDTIDHEHTRSYKEYQRLLSFRVSNAGHVPRPEMADGTWNSFDWSLLWRDIIPRRFSKSPFACDASPDIVAQTGPSIKHSLLYEYRMNNRFEGLDLSCLVELAGPPGDVGFAKYEGAASYNLPLFPTLINGASLNFSFHSGFVKALSFGGLCKDTTCISDRFFVGGPLQLRGFHLSGIGPRAETGGSLVPGGDSLGGEIFYTSTLATSIPFPLIATLRDGGFRVVGFLNTGTLSGWGVPMTSLLSSTRASVGAGVTLGTALGKMEATYSIPLRYGPRDIRQQAQFGFGFVFGG